MLRQLVYIESILQKYNFDKLQAVSLLMNPNTYFLLFPTTFEALELAYMCDILYKEVLSLLMYIVIATHLDIVFVVMLLLCFSSNPGPAH